MKIILRHKMNENSVSLPTRYLFFLIITWCAGCSSIKEHTPTPTEKDLYVSSEQNITRKLHAIVIPELAFRPPATIIDALDFFKQVSRDFDSQEIPLEQRGLSFILKLPDKTANQETGIVPTIPPVVARSICMWDALELVCNATNMKFYVHEYWVWIIPDDAPSPSTSSKKITPANRSTPCSGITGKK